MDNKRITELANKLVRVADSLGAVIEEFRSEGSVPIPPEIAKRFALFEEDKACLSCGKDLDAKGTTRGCHQSCYVTLRRQIREGRLTDSDAVLEGRVLPLQKTERAKENPLPPPPPVPLARAAIGGAAMGVFSKFPESAKSKDKSPPKKSNAKKQS